jgi:RNA methyltransferase, TrmH family
MTKSQVKYIQSLGQKKFREQEGLFVAEGPKMINDLLGNPRTALQGVFATKEWIASNAAARAVPESLVTELSHSELERISFLTSPHQVLGLFRIPEGDISVDPDNDLLLVLDGIQDPGNMGTLIRIADWFGITKVLCSPDCADAYAPKVVQASMGSIGRVQLQCLPLVEFFVKNPGIPLYAATLHGLPPASFGTLTHGAIVIGSEARGIQPELLSLARAQITIPGSGRAESLNAAVAGGIILAFLVGPKN